MPIIKIQVQSKMSSFHTKIDDRDRENCTVPPPPAQRKDGSMVQLYPLGQQRYADLALMKEDMTVYVDDELDAYDHPGSLRHYRMMIRCMPYRSDLNIIMAAARHMHLISDWHIEYAEREGLDPMLERGYWDVSYEIANEQMMADADICAVADVYVNYSLRCKVWKELFEAMGWHVKWGSSVLNVRKRR